MQTISLYTIFHLNLAYSSIEEEQRAEIIEKCYWPLVRLIQEYDVPLGIEASGYTLQQAASIDPSWVEELRQLTSDGKCQFIGSGYAQVIGPLIPAEVNSANLRLGNLVYEELLDQKPTIALVNEQAYSAGLIKQYCAAGYNAIIMEWDNPALYHPEWELHWRYLPQYACDEQGNKIALIWNNSIAFQKFQRYAHSEIELDEYLGYLIENSPPKFGALCLYGNDTEVFNFRPGRFHTETKLGNLDEWSRIKLLMHRLSHDEQFEIVSPSQVQSLLEQQGAGNILHLESAEQPIPVKKQGKYNITRWGLSGRNDLAINTACWRIYEQLRNNHQCSDNDWKELCYLWSSDFRTHITDKRWTAYTELLAEVETRLNISTVQSGKKNTRCKSRKAETVLPECKIERSGRYLTIETDTINLRLNCSRGLAIDSLFFKGVSDEPLIGTLPHGYYNDISLGADFYSGHLILEIPGQPKVTDLSPVEPTITSSDEGAFETISGEISTTMGNVRKGFNVFRNKPQIELFYELDCWEIPQGSMRLGHITLIPTAFKRDSLFYRTHNGGTQPDTFFVHNHQVDHGAPVSSLVSASCSTGMTQGNLEIGDDRRYLKLTVDKSLAALVGMVTYRQVDESYFCRVALSAAEMDETNLQQSAYRIPRPQKFCVTLSASLTDHPHEKQ